MNSTLLSIVGLIAVVALLLSIWAASSLQNIAKKIDKLGWGIAHSNNDSWRDNAALLDDVRRKIERLEGETSRLSSLVAALYQKFEQDGEYTAIRGKDDERYGRDAETGRPIYAPKGTIFIGRDYESLAFVFLNEKTGRKYYR